MKKEDKEFVQQIIDSEGFDYAFLSYSSFKKIEDEEFHLLRKKFVDSARELAAYIEVEI